MLTTRSTGKPSIHYWILAVFLIILFATGGASRADVQSLLILRPLSVIVCALACLTLRRGHLVGRGWLLGSAAAVFTLTLLHLAPLPQSMWQSFAGRQDLVEVGNLIGDSSIWRTLTLTPMNGWNALHSLFVPLSVLLLGIQLNRDDLFRLLPLIIVLAALSGLLGMLQMVGDPQGFLYFYSITNNGSPVGLFANRNHAAILLAMLFPMLVVYSVTLRGDAEHLRLLKLVAVAIAIVLVPLVLVTGSRSGLVGAVIGLSASALLYRRPAEVSKKRSARIIPGRFVPLLGGLALIGLVFSTYFLSRAEAIERMFAQSSGVDGRKDFWAVSLDLFWKYFPWGSGAGSFAEVYQITEPSSLLDASYLNHAHNDWIETAVTFGLPGIILLLLVVIAFIICSYRLWRNADAGMRAVAFGRLASAMIIIAAVASASDYPLRTPTMMGLFAICALWLTETCRDQFPSVITTRGEA